MSERHGITRRYAGRVLRRDSATLFASALAYGTAWIMLEATASSILRGITFGLDLQQASGRILALLAVGFAGEVLGRVFGILAVGMLVAGGVKLRHELQSTPTKE